MIKRPVFKSHLHVCVIPGEGVLLVSESESKALYGSVYELLAPLMDGTRSEDDIVDALAGKTGGADVYYALLLLDKCGLITESRPDIPLPGAAFWHATGIDPAVAMAALESAQVSIREVGNAKGASLHDALTDIGVRAAGEEVGDIMAVVTDDYLRPELEPLNEESIRKRRPWLLVKPVGLELWIGPLFVPGQTACYRCLSLRLSRNRPLQHFTAKKSNLSDFVPLARFDLAAIGNAACSLAALELATFIAKGREGLQNRVLSLNGHTWNAKTHELLKHPACPVCGRAEAAKPMPVALASCKVVFFQDGTYRTQTPTQTIRKYAHLVSPITGVVTALETVHEGDGSVYVCLAGHNPVFKMESLESLKRTLRHASSGKGVGEAQASAGALCEAIERYSGERHGSEVVVTASFREMRERFGPDAIHPNEVMLYSQRQIAQRELWNAKKSRFNRVVEPFDDTTPIDWTPLWSLTHCRHRYLPTQLLYYNSKASAKNDDVYCMGCSNGNASGNNLEEAVLQGFCELVERDAVAIWWYNRLKRPAVALESFKEPYLLDLIGCYQRLGREVWALDITSDLGIATFVAVSRLCEGCEERILLGFGSHLDPRIALQRAFCEMNQMLVVTNRGSKEKIAVEDAETLSWLKTATLANQPHIAPNRAVAARSHETCSRLCTFDLFEDISLCRRIVEERGMEVLVLDQTRPDVRMPVVKVIVPGLRHFWARFGPGRLYDVPVQMGWLPKALAEEELNPVSVFM